jgi:hypothetical protein
MALKAKNNCYKMTQTLWYAFVTSQMQLHNPFHSNGMVCIVPKITPILLEQSHAQGLQMAPYELIIPLISCTSGCLYDINQPQYK